MSHSRPARAQVKGGATVIHALGSSTKYSATTTPGEALLFRKDLEHEAELLEAGEKHLLSLNLWAMRKRTSGQVLLVSFPEAAEHDAMDEADSSAAAVAALKRAADAATTYAISVDDANSPMLQTHVAWHNRQVEDVGKAPSAVVPYNCQGCTHEEFGTIFRIMTQTHVSADELHANRALIDFFFPNFKTEHVLVDLATESSLQLGGDASVILGGLKGDLAELNGCRAKVLPPEPCTELAAGERVRLSGLESRPELNGMNASVIGLDEESKRYAVKVFRVKDSTNGGRPYDLNIKLKLENLQRTAEPKEVRLCVTRADGVEQNVVLPPCFLLADLEAEIAANAKAAAEATCAQAAEPFDAEVIVCESEERSRVVLEVARKLQLPYVPFKTLFVEGVTQFVIEGDPCTPRKIPVMAAWVSLGDYDNIFSYRKFASKTSDVVPLSLQTQLDEHDVFKPGAFGSGGVGMRPQEPQPAKSKFMREQFINGAHNEYSGLMPYHEIVALVERRWVAASPEDKAPYEASYAQEFAEYAPKLAEWQAKMAAIQLENEKACVEGNVGKEVNLEEFGVDDYETLQAGCCMGLRFCLPQTDTLKEAQGYLFEAHHTPSQVKVLPGGDDYGAAPAATEGDEAASALFHLDSSGKACFSAAEAKAASAHIATIQLDERVKACLQRKKFVLPQQSRNISEHFCNEAVYGKLNVLCVSGVVRLDATEAHDAEALPTFDAWPLAGRKVSIEDVEAMMSDEY